MNKDTKNPKKTTKSTKKTPVKNAKATKANNTKKVSQVKKAAPNKTEKKEVKQAVNNIPEVKSTKKVEKSNLFTKIKNIILKNWEERKEFVISCIVIVILACMIVFLAISKQVPKLKDGSEVLASVDGLKITTDDLYIDLKDSYGTNQLINLIDQHIADDYVKEFTKDDEAQIKEIVDYYKQYADYYGTSFEDFLSQYVGISGVSTEEEFKEYVKKDYKKTLAVQKYVGDKISEDELKKEFEKNYKEKLTVRHILIEVDEETTEDEAKKQAEELIKKLDKVKDDSEKLEKEFKDLAYDNSADQATYKDGGLYKDFSKGEVDENFYNAAKELKNGEYTKEPVKSQYGYHVILKVSSKTTKFKDVKDEVKTALAKEKLTNDATLQVTAWDELRKKYKLKINDTNISKEYKKTIENSKKSAEDSTKENNSTTNSNSTSSEEKED